jgi:diadenylate cyclase
MSTMWATLKTFQFKDAIDILVISLILYYLFKLLRQSRAGQLVKGVVVLLIAYGISALFNLTMVNFILRALFEFAVIIIVVVFQPELRQALERLGRSNRTLKNFVPNASSGNQNSVVKAIGDVSDVCAVFSSSKTGALIVFERDSVLSEVAATGTELNSDTSVALLGNIFFNKAPLHDGACVIRDGRILAAGCILPLTQSMDISDSLGTRHRAAIGMTEGSDAVVVVVSEETGVISISVGGRLIRDLDRSSLYDKLSDLLLIGESEKTDLLSVLFKNRKEKRS